MIDYKTLLDKLSKFNLHSSLIRRIAAFLHGRSQFVRIGTYVSTPQIINRGIPQGRKLGPILFAIMVNDLLSTCVPRVKFVDDLTATEIVPRNSSSLMRCIDSDTQSFTSKNDMKLYPRKCKHMSVDFLHYNSCEWQPIVTGATYVKPVSLFKLYSISSDLKMVRALGSNRRLYALS